MPETFGDQLGALAVVAAVQDVQVRRLGAEVDAGGAGVEVGVAVGTRGPVAGGAVGGFQADLAGALELRRVRVQRAFALPVVEDPGRRLPLARRFAPIARRERAVLLPGAAGHLQRTALVARDLQQADGRRLLLAALGEGELPPHPVDAGGAALVLDRVA